MTIDKASMPLALVALSALAPRGAAAAEPTLTVSDSVVAEGDSDSTVAVFTVSLSGGDPGQPVAVRWATEDLTASGLPGASRPNAPMRSGPTTSRSRARWSFLLEAPPRGACT